VVVVNLAQEGVNAAMLFLHVLPCFNVKVAVKTMIMIKGYFTDLQNFMRRIFELFNDNSKIKWICF